MVNAVFLIFALFLTTTFYRDSQSQEQQSLSAFNFNSASLDVIEVKQSDPVPGIRDRAYHTSVPSIHTEKSTLVPTINSNSYHTSVRTVPPEQPTPLPSVDNSTNDTSVPTIRIEQLTPMPSIGKKTNITSLPTAPTTQPAHVPISQEPLQNQTWRINKVIQMLVEGESNRPNDVILFTPNQWAGFCNNFRAIRGLALYSILKGFKMRIRWTEYFMVMKPSLSVLSKQTRSFCRMIPTFYGKVNQLDLHGCHTTDEIMDVTDELLSVGNNRRKLVELGLFSHIPKNNEVTHFMSKVFFQLNNVLQEEVDRFYAQYQNEFLVGVQLRTGGHLSNSYESSMFLTEAKLPLAYAFIQNAIRNTTVPKVMVFLSTDSSSVQANARKNLPYPVISSDVYRIGHSSPLRQSQDVLSCTKRAVVDLYLLSKCSLLITTGHSSFGDTANALSNASTKLHLFV